MSQESAGMSGKSGKPASRRRFLIAAGTVAAAAGAAWLVFPRPDEHYDPLSIGALPPMDGNDFTPDEAAMQAFSDLGIRTMHELDRLPWFTKAEDGTLLLRRDMGLPPIIDIHAHLGWRHGLGGKIDMMKRGPVAYLFDFDRDQDVLFEQDHPGGDEGHHLTMDSLTVLFRTPPRNRTHTAANLIAEMDAMGVTGACLLPIEIPFASRHAQDTLEACHLDRRFIPIGGVQPRSWGEKREAFLERQLSEYAIRGIKYHPEFQFIAPDTDDAMAMLGWCAEQGVVVLAHIGYTGSEPKFMRDMSEPERLVRALEAYPNLKLVCLHTGVRRIDDTLRVAQRFPEQCWLGLSGQPTNNIAYILQRYDTERILFGSDWPFYPLSVMIARVLAATEGNDTVRARVMHDNAAALLGLA